MRYESQVSRATTVWGRVLSVGREHGGERNERRARGLVSVPSDGMCSAQAGPRLTGAWIMLGRVSRG